MALNQIFFSYLNIMICPAPIKSYFKTHVLSYFTFTRYKDNHQEEQEAYIDLQLHQKIQ